MSINLKKINLKKEGDWANIPVKNLHCKLQWTKPVDLDFHAYYSPKLDVDVPQEEKKGIFKRLFGSDSSASQAKQNKEGLVYFGNRGSKSRFPFIYLDQDAGIGDTGGDNEEKLYFTDLAYHDYVLIVANIFNKSNASFASYDGKVVLTADNQEFTVPLTSKEHGSYCVVAYIDNTGVEPKLINVNKTFENKPKISDFINK